MQVQDRSRSLVTAGAASSDVATQDEFQFPTRGIGTLLSAAALVPLNAPIDLASTESTPTPVNLASSDVPATPVGPLPSWVDFDNMLEASWKRDMQDKADDHFAAVKAPIEGLVKSTIKGTLAEVDSRLPNLEIGQQTVFKIRNYWQRHWGWSRLRTN